MGNYQNYLHYFQLSKKCLVQVDCSQCQDYYYNRDSAIHVLGMESNTTEVSRHCKNDHFIFKKIKVVK